MWFFGNLAYTVLIKQLKFPYLEGEKKSSLAYSISVQQREFTTFLRGT